MTADIKDDNKRIIIIRYGDKFNVEKIGFHSIAGVLV